MQRPHRSACWWAVPVHSGQPRCSPAEARNPTFRGRSVLLTDHHTRSAGEMVSHSFRYAGMGPIIGTTTAGHVLAASIEVMPGKQLITLGNRITVSDLEAFRFERSRDHNGD